MAKKKFCGIMPALITPFDENERVKRQAVKELLDCEYASGINGFYINGSTGEGPVLGVSTRMEMSEAVMEYNAGRGVIIEHIGAPDFKDAVALTKHANESGVDAISSLAPNFYFSFSNDEIVEYYKRIASLTDKPLLVYVTNLLKGDIVSLIERLMQIENVIGLKFTLPDYYLMRKLREVNGGDINIINGPDEMLLCGLAMGAHGGIGSTYNIMPEWYCQLYKSFTEGDFAAAQEMQYRINKVITILLKHGENGTIKSIKAAFNLRGIDVGNAIFPSKVFSASENAALKADLAAAGIIL